MFSWGNVNITLEKLHYVTFLMKQNDTFDTIMPDVILFCNIFTNIDAFPITASEHPKCNATKLY